MQEQARQKIKRLLNGWGPVVLLTLGTLWLLQAALAKTAGHGVILRGLNYDAGAVRAGAVVTDEVQVVNLSSQPVEVDAQPGCGCTVVDVPSKPIAPLHSEVIRANVDTDSMNKGAQQKSVMLYLRSDNRTWQRLVAVNFRLK